MDLIAGNHGLNSPYRASAQAPVRLYFGDLGGRGMMDLVEAYMAPELQAVVPRRTLGALSQALPLLSASFATFREFSTAGVGEIFQRLQVQPAELTASVLASMVFLNRGTQFQSRLLPVPAQWSSVQGIVPADFDGDGRMDLFVAQNLFDQRPDLSRLDAGRGLLLHGTADGSGRFEPVDSSTSGIVVDGDQRGAATADFDEDARLDLVITQNGAATRLMRNVTGSPGLRVRLSGPPGNPDGVGAVVRARTSAGLGPAWEVHAGAGYWSQDAGVVLAPGSGERNKILGISVRWAGGRLSEHVVPDGVGEMRIRLEGDTPVP